MLFEAFGIALVLLLLPLVHKDNNHNRISLLSSVYFLAIGAGCIFVELFFIYEYTILFGDPLISLSVVLSGILIFSGFGGVVSQQISRDMNRIVLVTLIFFLVIYFCFTHMLIDKMLGINTIILYLLSFILLLLPGFCMGFPFTWGMKHLLRYPGQRAHAWAANGAASVVASIMSMQIALDFGVTIVLACGIIMYIISFIVFLNRG